jgi:chromosomal replication initiator protein
LTTAQHPFWVAVVEGLPRRLSRTRVDQLLGDVRFVTVDEASLRIGLSQSRVPGWMQSGELAQIDAHVAELSDCSIELTIIPIRDDESCSAGDPTLSLERFVVGPANQTAYDAALALAGDAAIHPGLLVLAGPANSGKSHLLSAISQKLAARTESESVRPLAAGTLASELVVAIRERELDAFRSRYRSYPALLLDDLHHLADRTATQHELASAIEALLASGKPVVLTSAIPPLELRDFSERLRSTLRGAYCLPLRLPDWETRVALVLQRIAAWGVPADERDASLIVGELGERLGRLDALLTRLLIHSPGADNLADGDSIRDALQARPRLRGIGAEAVMGLVIRHFGIRARELRSATRSPRVTIPRQIVMYLLRRHCALSYPEIGRRLGRHHTTALHSVRQVTRLLERNGNLRATVRLLEKELKRVQDAGG